MNQLHTTRSWEFLGLEENGIVPKDSIWEKARYGEDTIIGNLDTGKLHTLIVFSFYDFVTQFCDSNTIFFLNRCMARIKKL